MRGSVPSTEHARAHAPNAMPTRTPCVLRQVGELQDRTQRAVLETHRTATSFSRRLFRQQRSPAAPSAAAVAAVATTATGRSSDGGAAVAQQQEWLEHGVSARQEDDALDAQLDDDEAAIAGVLLELE